MSFVPGTHFLQTKDKIHETSGKTGSYHYKKQKDDLVRTHKKKNRPSYLVNRAYKKTEGPFGNCTKVEK